MISFIKYYVESIECNLSLLKFKILGEDIYRILVSSHNSFFGK